MKIIVFNKEEAQDYLLNQIDDEEAFAKTTASIVDNCSLLVDSSSFMSFLIPNL